MLQKRNNLKYPNERKSKVPPVFHSKPLARQADILSCIATDAPYAVDGTPDPGVHDRCKVFL